MSTALCHQAHNENDPLAVFVAKAGGLDPNYCGGMRQGELRRIRELRRGLPPGAINKDARLTLEEMTELVQAEGFMIDNDIDHFLDLLERDVNACADGRHLDRVYRVDSQAAQDVWDSQADAWAEMQEGGEVETDAVQVEEDIVFDAYELPEGDAVQVELEVEVQVDEDVILDSLEMDSGDITFDVETLGEVLQTVIIDQWIASSAPILRGKTPRTTSWPFFKVLENQKFSLYIAWICISSRFTRSGGRYLTTYPAGNIGLSHRTGGLSPPSPRGRSPPLPSLTASPAHSHGSNYGP